MSTFNCYYLSFKPQTIPILCPKPEKSNILKIKRRRRRLERLQNLHIEKSREELFSQSCRRRVVVRFRNLPLQHRHEMQVPGAGTVQGGGVLHVPWFAEGWRQLVPIQDHALNQQQCLAANKLKIQNQSFSFLAEHNINIMLVLSDSTSRKTSRSQISPGATSQSLASGFVRGPSHNDRGPVPEVKAIENTCLAMVSCKRKGLIPRGRTAFFNASTTGPGTWLTN